MGAGKSLFKKEFYNGVNNSLKSNGIAIFQSGVTFLQKKETREVIQHVKGIFKKSGVMLTVVPSYIGGFMALVWSSNQIDMLNSKIVKGRKKIKTLYYNDEIRKASLCSPNFIKLIL